MPKLAACSQEAACRQEEVDTALDLLNRLADEVQAKHPVMENDDMTAEFARRTSSGWRCPQARRRRCQ